MIQWKTEKNNPFSDTKQQLNLSPPSTKHHRGVFYLTTAFTDFSTAEVLLCILMPKSVVATDILSVFPGNKDTFQAQFHNCMLG